MSATIYPPKDAGLERLITERRSCWERLKAERRPIFIYGMGDGAAKIMSAFERFGIPVAGIFASDAFVRGHSFAGFRVHKLSEIEEQVDDPVIVLAFAAGYPELVDYIRTLSKRHTLYVPDVPVIGGGLFDYQYCMAHLQELNEVYRSLADDESRRVYLNVIQFKISGDMRYLDDVTASTDDICKKILRPTRGESYVDLGAYNGDTIRELLAYTGGRYASVTALEPDARTFKKLKKYAEQAGLDRVRLLRAGAWREPGEL